ncbi:MAG: NAD-dependent epimerase/dehydratase family protein [Planctomycetota bacterium]|nr:MAG: NAD-dependent epimerase/dehydratase family protein [Planctomycetota bacterium]
MAILVTGAAGFIGSHFVERLLAERPDARIVALDDFNAYYDPALKRQNAAGIAGSERVTLVEGSFGDARLVEDVMTRHEVRAIVHLGGYAGVRASVSMPLAYAEANVQGTLVLLEAARLHPVERFVLASSSTVYGAGCDVPFREDAPLGVPLSPYGASKRAAEIFAEYYTRMQGVPAVWLRPFSVYGPRMRPDLAMHVFASAITAGRPIPLFGDGSYQRDFTHVSDVCAGLLSAMTAEGVVGQAINLGHHKPVAVAELVRLLEDALGRQANIDRKPAFAGDMPVTCADLSKAERLLGYRPRVTISEGVRDFVAWFRGQSTG